MSTSGRPQSGLPLTLSRHSRTMRRSGLMTFLDRYSLFEALFLERATGWASVGGQGGVGELIQPEECLRTLPRPGDIVVSRRGRPSQMTRFG